MSNKRKLAQLIKLEEAVKSRKASFVTCRKLLKMYFFDFPKKQRSKRARDLVVYAVKNFPNRAGDWTEWASHFLLSSKSKKEVVGIWKNHVSANGSKRRILQHAGEFCVILDPAFASGCFMKLFSMNNHDLDALAYLAKALAYSGQQDKAFEYFQLLISRRGKSILQDVFDLSEAVISAHEVRNYKTARKWEKLLRLSLQQNNKFTENVREIFSMRGIKFYI